MQITMLSEIVWSRKPPAANPALQLVPGCAAFVPNVSVQLGTCLVTFSTREAHVSVGITNSKTHQVRHAHGSQEETCRQTTTKLTTVVRFNAYQIQKSHIHIPRKDIWDKVGEQINRIREYEILTAWTMQIAILFGCSFVLLFQPSVSGLYDRMMMNWRYFGNDHSLIQVLSQHVWRE